MELIELLDVCLEADKNQFIPQVGNLCIMLGKVGVDSNPDMKNKFAQFVGKLATTMDKSVGSYMKGIVDSLV